MLLEIQCGMPVQAKKLQGQLHTGRPDSDNILKAVKDALVDAGVLEDHGQIVATETVEAYASPWLHCRQVVQFGNGLSLIL